MARKPNSKNQLTFSFEVSADDIFALEGGSQNELSQFEREMRMMMKRVLEEVAKRDVDPLDRYEIAARMSRKLGREVPKSRLDEWTAMACVSRRMHVDSLKAFCEVVGDMRPIHMLVESCGLKALTPDLALCAEWGAAEVLRRSLASKQKTLGNELENPGVIDALAQRLLSGGKA